MARANNPVSNPTIQWYPGHIAKAEKQLQKNLNKVDLVIEVRDARIPLATAHPDLIRWTKGKQHLLVVNRLDMISLNARKEWDEWLRRKGLTPWWCNAKQGTGIKQLQQAIIRSGSQLNERRVLRGMRPRPVRALTIGFPNVGKSALINRLVRQKAVASERRAGVTRTLRWIRVGQDIDLLDAPGVLPTRLNDQHSALLLALCNDIGQAAYDIETVAISFINILKQLEDKPSAGVKSCLLEKKYGIALETEKMGAFHWLNAVSKIHTSSDRVRMSQRIVDDYRRTSLGLIALELP